MNERPLSLDALPRGFRGALILVCYALRSLRGRVMATCENDYRKSNFGNELTGAITGEHRHGMAAIIWLDRLAQRWGVSLAGDAENPKALALWMPEGWVPWERAMAVVRRGDLARIVAEYGAFSATFACAPESDDDVALLASIDEPDEVAAPWVPTLPTTLLAPRWFTAVWTSTSDIAHGADTKDGNVQRFRTEPRTDLLTGASYDAPFLSGNSVRGQMRDMLAADMLHRLGLSPLSIPPRTASSLFAGGSIEAGADTTANTTTRRMWREVPMVDLLGGCCDNQVLEGYLRIQDAITVCRETASMVAPAIAPGMDARELAARLHEARSLFIVRQLTRRSHRDIAIEGEKSDQALVRTELVKAGTQWVHAVALTGAREVPASPLVASCLAHGIDLLRSGGSVGAGSARGHGSIAFDAYKAPDGTTLPSADVYRVHLDAHGDRLRAILRGEAMGATGSTSTKARGKGKAAKAPAVTAAPEALFGDDVHL